MLGYFGVSIIHRTVTWTSGRGTWFLMPSPSLWLLHQGGTDYRIFHRCTYVVFLSASKHGEPRFIVSSKGLLVMSAQSLTPGGRAKSLARDDHPCKCWPRSILLSFWFSRAGALAPRYQSTLLLPGSVYCRSVKLQALVYIFLPTTAITDYAIGLEKLSANEQFFVGAQMEVPL